MTKLLGLAILVAAVVFLLFTMFMVIAEASSTDIDKYAVEQPDGSIHILNYLLGSKDSLETIVHEGGYDGMPIIKLKDSDFPADRSDRNFWKLNIVGKKIGIDTAKKAAFEAAKAVKEARKQALLKMTPTEYQEAKDLGLVR